MAQTFNTTALLAQIRKQARLADDDTEATDAILLESATQILQSKYAPAVRAVRSDYYVIPKRIALEAGRPSYNIPHRAVTSSVRRVRLLDSTGRELPMAQVPFEDIVASVQGPCPSVYAILDDRIAVSPVPNAAAYSLEIVFEYRPAQLVLTSAAYPITVGAAYDSDTHVLGFSGPPGLALNTVVDVVRATAPFSSPIIDGVVADRGFGNAVYEITPFCGEHAPLGIAVGDYMCLAGESPVPQIPAELHPILAKHTAADWLLPIDPAGAVAIQSEADRDMERALKAMAPRKQGVQQRMRPRVRSVMTSGQRGGRGTFGDIR